MLVENFHNWGVHSVCAESTWLWKTCFQEKFNKFSEKIYESYFSIFTNLRKNYKTFLILISNLRYNSIQRR